MKMTELLVAFGALEAENKKLRQGIIDGDSVGISLVPNDIWDSLQAENKDLAEKLNEVRTTNAELGVQAVDALVERDSAQAENKLLRERLDAIEQLCACYRMQRSPTEKLMRKLDKTFKALKQE